MELAVIVVVAIAVIFVATAWGMAYGWHRGWEDARGYYWHHSWEGQKEAQEDG